MYSTVNGGCPMNIFYNSKTDLLYFRLEEKKEEVINKRVSDNIVTDIGEDGKIIGIEIMDASKNLHLDSVLPIKYETPKTLV